MTPLARLAPSTRWLPPGLALLFGLALFGLLHLDAPAPVADAAHGDAYIQELDPSTATIDAPVRHQRRHLAALGVDRWHAQGHRGQKVKIAILDSGFQGYKAELGRALPAQVTTRSFRIDGKLEQKDSQHGVLCAEVVHAVAPKAELLLTNWEPNDPQSFLQAVRWARDEGARVISCSLIMPSWSDGEGGGIVNQGIADIAGAGDRPGDLLFFASAGNTAQRHWCGTFAANADGYHQWQQGEAVNILTPWGKERVAVELYGPAAGNYDLIVLDAFTGQSVGQQQSRSLGNKTGKINCLLVRFTPDPANQYHVLVRAKTPAAHKDKMHLVALGGNLTHACNHGSIACPADGAGVCAVGAVNQDGQRWHYSSCGPNSALPKPDYVALVPFPIQARPQPFGGTSAAAPQAAGLAALWWSKHAHWSAHQVKDAMKKSALDLGPIGHDYETGYGMVRVP